MNSVGYKGKQTTEPGYVWSPYVPITKTSVWFPTRIVAIEHFWGKRHYWYYQETFRNGRWSREKKVTEEEYLRYQLEQL